MFLSMKKMAGALLLLALAFSASAAPPQKREPLTDFQPSKDFFRVPNDREGYCLGIVESAIANWAMFGWKL